MELIVAGLMFALAAALGVPALWFVASALVGLWFGRKLWR